jgi:hypothetical protein
MTSPPDWATAVPPTQAVHPSGTPDINGSMPVPGFKLSNFIAQFLENFLGKVVAAIVGSFIPGAIGSAFSQLQNWSVVLLPAQILAAVQTLIDSLVNILTGGSSTGNANTGIAAFLTPELDFLHSLGETVGTIYEDLSASIAKLEGRVSSVETTQAAGTRVAGFDDCTTVTRFTNVSGTLASNGDSILSTATAVGYHTDGPATILHGVIVQLDRKQQGLCRATICGDTGFTNYLALEFFTNGYGDDYARLVVGSGPNTVIELTQPSGAPVQWSGTINTNWVWEVYYSNAPVANTFYVVRNGTPVTELQYTDTTNLVTHTAGTDIHVGWVSNANNNSVFKGCAVAGFNYEDRPV